MLFPPVIELNILLLTTSTESHKFLLVVEDLLLGASQARVCSVCCIKVFIILNKKEFVPIPNLTGRDVMISPEAIPVGDSYRQPLYLIILA